MNVIELIGVSKYYAIAGGTLVKAVEDIDLSISVGDFAMIFGRSGSGKTTLLSIMAGLISPTKGEVRVNGMNLNRMGEGQRSRLRNETIGFIFQQPTLIPYLTVVDNVRLPRFFSKESGERDLEEALSLLNSVGLSDKARVFPSQLSAGQMRRVQVARALMNKPKVLLADEPTGELDEATEIEIMELLRSVHDSGVTIVMVSHSNELARYANRLFKMEVGRLREVS
ncbi:MAG: ABC transporter ATP-binding protein [Aigarchaeota archaeon]|nr:ABC transporter ATP-binding protein [Aigarchaeota archaeon]MDW8092072.1 ABC transporter ATP-binding protein [Nitrososphaerota archaeon]